ncbi:MAG: MFS transporter [Eubacteriales bacterium]|nr:MFS transporter [Eubacteriales bacterium]MDD3074045.1 MFS transporter [Eubacteriales bacterium]MDD4079765.1 MFS transporter [Eubacteriales bacterium]MDD4769534.1 MFS transporter [Eubacteriales bacterium]
MDKPYKFSYGKIFVLGLGFGVISLTWAIYNAYVPLILESLLVGTTYLNTTVGIIMTMDNIAAITLIPFIGALSDKTWTRFGRRMPFLMFGIPIAAVFFAAIPYMATSLWVLIPIIVIMNIAMAAFRAPTIALMPDLTPSHLRSKANGIVNFMGGLGSIVFYGVFTMLFTEEKGNIYTDFPVASIVMIVVLIILMIFIREPREQLEQSDKKSEGIFSSLMKVFKEKEASTRLLLAAIFCWFIGWNGVETYFTLYGTEIWELTKEAAAQYLTYFSLAFLLMAIPSGFIASAIGRKKTIIVGVVGMGIMLAVAYTIGVPWPMAAILLGCGGIFWALVNINSFPMVADMAPAAKLGLYTGLYYFSSQLAAILAPPVFGFVMDYTSRKAMFPMASLAFVLALICISGVRRGEAKKSA